MGVGVTVGVVVGVGVSVTVGVGVVVDTTVGAGRDAVSAGDGVSVGRSATSVGGVLLLPPHPTTRMETTIKARRLHRLSMSERSCCPRIRLCKIKPDTFM